MLCPRQQGDDPHCHPGKKLILVILRNAVTKDLAENERGAKILRRAAHILRMTKQDEHRFFGFASE